MITQDNEERKILLVLFDDTIKSLFLIRYNNRKIVSRMSRDNIARYATLRNEFIIIYG